MVKTKEELLSAIDTAEISDELKIELMEDISDSFVIPEPVSVEEDEKFIELSNKYAELLERYKKRFMEGSEEPEKEEIEEEKKEDDVIDVKEI